MDRKRQEQLSFLHKFFAEGEMLNLCSQLLPDLVQFYRWLHVKLAYLLTRDKVCRLTIGNVVENLPNRFSMHHADEIQKLFRRVQGILYFSVMANSFKSSFSFSFRKLQQVRIADSNLT